MATVAPTSLSTLPTSHKPIPFLSSSTTALRFHSPISPPSPLILHFPVPATKPLLLAAAAAASNASSSPASTFHGSCYVLGDNIDTDQIIPAEHLTLVPSKPDEYRKLGALALVGLPHAIYPIPFVDPNSSTTRYPVVIAGANFGCGSSREHAPVALGAAGVRAVVAESYARIFFRNSVATGEVYPVETGVEGLYKECTTGDLVTVDMEESKLINHTTRKEYPLKPIGDAGPVIDAGGIFAYARKTGMIASDLVV